MPVRAKSFWFAWIFIHAVACFRLPGFRVRIKSVRAIRSADISAVLPTATRAATAARCAANISPKSNPDISGSLKQSLSVPYSRPKPRQNSCYLHKTDGFLRARLKPLQGIQAYVVQHQLVCALQDDQGGAPLS